VTLRRIALTFIGRDRPGIIAGVSQILFEAGCNIEDATMTLLEGEFAMILIASLPRMRVEKNLKKAYRRFGEKWGLDFSWKTIPRRIVWGEKHPRGTKSCLLSVIGRDRTGIVYETSRILAKYQLNITDLNSRILGSGDKTVFTMILEVDIPEKFDLKRLAPDCKRVKKKLGVDIRIRPLERLSL